MNDSTSVIDHQTRLMANPNMVLRVEDDDCAILFDPDAGSVRILNVTAAAVWQLLDGERSVDDILVRLRDMYSGFETASEAQVFKLLSELQSFGALASAEE